jgi:hypothetical protein
MGWMQQHLRESAVVGQQHQPLGVAVEAAVLLRGPQPGAHPAAPLSGVRQRRQGAALHPSQVLECIEYLSDRREAEALEEPSQT